MSETGSVFGADQQDVTYAYIYVLYKEIEALYIYFSCQLYLKPLKLKVKGLIWKREPLEVDLVDLNLTYTQHFD
jgi:hypothetical protein